MAHLADSVALVEQAGAAMLHVDVMDGHFVPNITMGIPFVKALKSITQLPLDVHLMVSNPLDQIPWFIDAGATLLTIHQEALSEDELRQALDMMDQGAVSPALSIKPQTNPEVLAPVLSRLDRVLVMSVEPGFSGQTYIAGSELKVATLRAMAEELHCGSLEIEVDGGINSSTIGPLSARGARIFVCGNSIFKQQDPASALNAIREAGRVAMSKPVLD